MLFREDYHKLETDKGIIFFLRGELSQWFPSKFTYRNLEFSNCEQFMMYEKAMLFKDEDIAIQIMNNGNPAICKKLGRQVSDFDETIWDKHKFSIVCKGNFCKFSQNDKLYNILMKTKNNILAEANGHDKIWGIGMFENNPDRYNKELWGKNLLGKTLMKVRKLLK